MTAEEIRQAYQALGKDHPAIKALLFTYDDGINSAVDLLANSSEMTEPQIRYVCGQLSAAIDMRNAIKGAVGN